MKKIVKAVIGVSIIAALVLGSLLAINVFKLSYTRIETGSMEPNLPVDTRVFASGVVDYKPNQAITFVADGHVVTHVFLGYNKDGSLITRGVANPSNDEWRTPVYPKDVKGPVLFQVLILAPVFWQGRSGTAVIGGLLLVLFSVIGSIMVNKSDSATEQVATT